MKNLLLLLMAPMISIAGMGQEAEAEKNFRFGLKLAPAVNWLKPNVITYENEGTTFGFSYGLMADYLLGKSYLFSTGFEINSSGGKLAFPDVARPIPNADTTFFPGTSEATYRLQYVTLPLLLKMRTNEIGAVRYYGEFGLGLSVNINAEQDLKTSYDGGTISVEDIDISDEIRLLRSSLVIGLGAEYNITGTTVIVAGLTFSNGFTNVLNGNIYEVNDDNEVVFDGNTPREGPKKKAISNFVALNLGILF